VTSEPLPRSDAVVARFHSGPAGEFTWSSLAEASIYLVGGALLIFFAAGIADVFEGSWNV
jgi:hypothetical protein